MIIKSTKNFEQAQCVAYILGVAISAYENTTDEFSKKCFKLIIDSIYELEKAK